MKFKKIIIEGENLATRLAEIAFEKNIICVNRNHVKEAKNYKKEEDEIDTEEITETTGKITINDVEFIDFNLDKVSSPEGFQMMRNTISKKCGLVWNPRYDTYFKSSLLTEKGFYKSWTLGDEDGNTCKLRHYNGIHKKSGLNNGSRWRITVSYTDFEDPNSGILTVRMISKLRGEKKRLRDEEEDVSGDETYLPFKKIRLSD